MSDNAPLKKVVEGILHRLVNNDPLYLHDGRYVRWGKVQQDINSAIDILAQPKSVPPEERAINDEAIWDKCRLDYLATEAEEEQRDIAKIGHVKMLSVFRRNVPITREQIDDAMRFRESINLKRDGEPLPQQEGKS